MPTTWVRKTALPVLNAPSPVENSIDWVASRRDIGVGGISRRKNPGRESGTDVVITGILTASFVRCRHVFPVPRSTIALEDDSGVVALNRWNSSEMWGPAMRIKSAVPAVASALGLAVLVLAPGAVPAQADSAPGPVITSVLYGDYGSTDTNAQQDQLSIDLGRHASSTNASGET